MHAFDTLDWDDLKIFLHAARGGSLGSAAKRLRVDQSTISRRIAHLETTLGRALFERLPSGLKVNEAGDRLLCHAERIESAVIAMREDVQCGDSRMAGRVRFATLATEPRVSATAIQTVGAKGYDGFAIVLVTADI